MYRRSFLAVLPGALGMAAAQMAQPESEWQLNRPKVPGTLSLRARRRVEQPPGSGNVRPSEEELRWEVAQTAIIICDMWDTHTCPGQAQRVAVMAPRMNQVVNAARNRGVMIFHCPSDTIKYYEGRPERLRMQRAPMASSPIPIKATVQTPEERRIFPISGGCSDPIDKEYVGPGPKTTRGNYPWEREHPAIDIVGFDGISDDGQEVYNYCKQEGITNLAIMGVHTNACILDRSFAIRMMTRLGFNMVLVRDLTDAGYDPRRRPFVSEARGTELVVEHIEARWCPSILSDDLTRVIPGTDGPIAR
ncbi:MAG: isochorismatase family protein [Acidobacteriia bacterium]|nr:isochorismatase family protein [Terriglobia bacterium]